MTDLFDTLVVKLIAVEGGYSNNPADKGGETMWGITSAVARENGFAGAMAAMTREQAIAIYRAKYWAKPGLYLVAPLSAAIAGEMLDTGVNMGTGTAAIFLQRALNVLNRRGIDYPDIPVDGGIGPTTAGALASFLKRNPQNGETVILRVLNCLQGARYVELGENTPDNELFENGWFANRIGLAA